MQWRDQIFKKKITKLTRKLTANRINGDDYHLINDIDDAFTKIRLHAEKNYDTHKAIHIHGHHGYNKHTLWYKYGTQ